jgi:TonB family protein
VNRIAMNRITATFSCLALGLALAGCGSTSAPRGAEVTEADATAFRQSEIEKRLQQQVTPPLDSTLRLLQFAEPRYPSFLLGDNRPDSRGDVSVTFEILTSGFVGSTQIAPGANEAFHKPATNAVRQWRFTPPVRDGKPVRLFLKHTFRMEP